MGVAFAPPQRRFRSAPEAPILIRQSTRTRWGGRLGGLLETIWIGRSSGDIVQVPEVEAELSDEVLNVGAPVTDIAIGYGAIWVSAAGRPA